MSNLKFFIQEKGIGVIGVIIFFLVAGVMGSGLYYYLQKQAPSDIEITQVPSVVCENGECIDQCVSNYIKKCDSNDVYWYDSCGKRLDQVEKCGIDLSLEQYQCSSDKKYTQRKQQTSSCISGACQFSYSWKNIENCFSIDKECSDGSCVQKKCTDGTPWEQCSATKPRYCENGSLIERASLCGCPADYEFDGDQCRQKLSNKLK